MLSALRLLTINHHTAGLSRLQDSGLRPEAVTGLHGALAALGIEAVVLATCNRSELYWRCRSSADDDHAVRLMSDAIRTRPGEHLAPLVGAAAARHLFRVCAGLESLIVGEAEILGQVRIALSAATCESALLARVFTAALRTGGLVRSGTGLSRGAVSVASVTVGALASVIDLRRACVLIVGAGRTATKVARHVRRVGVGRLVIANRTRAHADMLALGTGAEVVPLDRLQETLPSTDAVVMAAGHTGWLLTVSDLEAAQRRRGERPLVVADLSVPSAIEPGHVAGVTHIDMTRLDDAIRENRERRVGDIPRAEAILERELAALDSWARHKACGPRAATGGRAVPSAAVACE